MTVACGRMTAARPGPPAPKIFQTRFPAFFCNLRFGHNFLTVLGFEVWEDARERVARSPRYPGVTPIGPAPETGSRRSWPRRISRFDSSTR